MFKLNAVFTQRVQKFIYRHATRKLETEDVVFLNYGYEEEPAMGRPAHICAPVGRGHPRRSPNHRCSG